jgi:hypothetical protein
MLEKYLGFYVWQGMNLLKNVALLKELPAVTNRLLLSFTAADYRYLATSNGVRMAKSFISKANRRGIRVELLIGEPTLVLPFLHDNIQSYVKVFERIPFDGVQLDCERDQLPDYQRYEWDDGIFDLVNATRYWLARFTERNIPVGFTAHHRELGLVDLRSRLCEAAYPEIIAMYYASNPETVMNITKYTNWGGLNNSLAVSIESVLSSEESTFQRGRIESLEQWNDLHSRLKCPIVVQSFEDYMKAEVFWIVKSTQIP